MAGRGRIRAADIALVRERSRIDEVVGDHLQLKRAGGGSLKGLCPFHDEKSPSFHVTPSRGLYHCLAGETGVLTEGGVVPIRELAGRTVRVLDGDGGWVEAPFRSYGVQRLMELTLTRNGRTKVLHATDEHRWFVSSGPRRQDRRETVTRDLLPGDRLTSSVDVARPALPVAAADAPRSTRQAVAALLGRKEAEVARWVPDAGADLRSRPVRALEAALLRTAWEHSEARHLRRSWVVRSVEWSDRTEEVFCAEVPGTHAFTLEDDILTGNCFGCGVGGDVIRFVQEMDHLSFTEAVELLAGRANVELHYEDDGGRPTGAPDRSQAGQRARLVAANTAAAAFYAAQLGSPEAAPARQFLADRGFDRQVALDFGCGFAPGGWDTLTRHLRGNGFTQQELVTAGLASSVGAGSALTRVIMRRMFAKSAVESNA